MTNDLEQRLAALEEELAKAKSQAAEHDPQPQRKLKPAKKHRRKARLFTLIFLLVVIVLGGGFGFYATVYRKTPQAPLPHELITSLPFVAYYPQALPSGYSYTNDSATTESGVLFFKIHSGDKEVLFIEQANPKNNLLLDSTVGLNPIDTPNGKAYVGKNKAVPVGIIQAKNTLVNITGSADVPDDVINGIIRDLKPVQ